MPIDPSRLSVIASRIRGVARVWSILVWLLALILMVGTRNAPSTSNLGNDPLDILIPVSLFISLIGLGIAWRWEGWGVLINIRLLSSHSANLLVAAPGMDPYQYHGGTLTCDIAGHIIYSSLVPFKKEKHLIPDLS